MGRWLRQYVPFSVWLLTCLAIGGLFAWSYSLSQSIQSSRRDAQVRSCRETNDRNRATIAQFDKELAVALKATKDPVQRRRIRASVGANKRLINAIVPVHPNCDAFADRRVTGQPPP